MNYIIESRKADLYLTRYSMIKIDIENKTKKKIENIICKDAFSGSPRSLIAQLSVSENEAFLRKYTKIHDFLYDTSMIKYGVAIQDAIRRENIIELLTANFDGLMGFIKNFSSMEFENDKSKWEEIFCFTSFSRRLAFYYVLDHININVCPYCNRQYITTISNDKIRQAHMDHFFCQEKYPYLALSIWNLIPSCSYCNGKKSNKDMCSENRMLYPYSEEFGEKHRFRVIPEDNRFMQVFQGISKEFSIDIDHLNDDDGISSKVRISEETLHLISLYNTHREYVRKLLYSRYVLTDLYKNEMFSTFSNLFKDERDMLISLIPDYVEKSAWGQVPLAKLTHDLMEERY